MRSILMVWLLVAAPALGQTPLVAEGERIAQRWCAQCHAIAPGAAPPSGDAAPGLPGIAALPRSTPDRLRAFLSRPHADMPDHQLTRAEMDAVLAYLASLRP